MGFGFLLVGFITAFIFKTGMGTYGFAAVMLGNFLMFSGFSRLKEYNGRFAWAQAMTVPMLIISVYSAFSWMNDMFLFGFDLTVVGNIIDIVKACAELAELVLMFWAIAGISVEVGLPKVTSRAYTALPAVVLTYAYIFVVFFLGLSGDESIDIPFLSTLEVVVCIACYVYSAVVLFNCYMYICPEGEEDMEPKPSRFGFINKIREKQDEREARAKEDAKAYLEERRRRKEHKKKKKK